uniref:G_PROTEIN_RECEP_F1_2 domain-containing protein n=1 Tax=Onchocerca volvulus TaxID=6282 RepID=A0A8R1XQ31_ONCVO
MSMIIVINVFSTVLYAEIRDLRKIIKNGDLYCNVLMNVLLVRDLRGKLKAMTTARVEYVLQEDIVANILRNHAGNANLKTTIILLGLFATLSASFNIILLTTILLSRKLRSVQLFILFCNLAILNIFDIFSSMFIPILFIINDNWLFDTTLCRLNATFEQFISMELLMSIMLMAIEHTVKSFFPNQLIFKNWRTLAYIIVLWIISICLAVPILTRNIPVKPSEFWYNCSVDSKVPILYPIVCIFIYGTCLVIILICFAVLLSRNNHYKKQLLSMESRESSILTLEIHTDYLSISKLILLLIILFILFYGPYIILNFFIQIRNSDEILKDNFSFEVPQDAATILHWLRLMYPLLTPILIYASYAEIWLKVRQCIFCLRSEAISIGNYSEAQEMAKEITGT